MSYESKLTVEALGAEVGVITGAPKAPGFMGVIGE